MQILAVILAGILFAYFFPEDARKVAEPLLRRVWPEADIGQMNLMVEVQTVVKVVSAIAVAFVASQVMFTGETFPRLHSDQVVLVDGDVHDLSQILARSGDFNSAKRVIFLDETKSIRPSGNMETITSVNELEELAHVMIIHIVDGSTMTPQEQLTHIQVKLKHAIRTTQKSLRADGRVIFTFSEYTPLMQGFVRAAASSLNLANKNHVKAVAYSDKWDVPTLVLDCTASSNRCQLDERVSAEQVAITILAAKVLDIPQADVNPVIKETPPTPKHQEEEEEERYAERELLYPQNGFFRTVILFATRLLCFIYPGSLTARAYFDDEEQLLLWHKYWVVFAAACILEDMLNAVLHWTLFIPAEVLKMVMLAKCIYPSPTVAGEVFDVVLGAIGDTYSSLQKVVDEEVEKQKAMMQASDKSFVLQNRSDSDSDSDYGEMSKDGSDSMDSSPQLSSMSSSSSLRRRKKQNTSSD